MIGVISLHAEAPREFTQDDSDFMMHAASLVAGAIENARLYERTRRRLTLVEGLADLSRAVSGASTLEQLLPAVVRRAQRPAARGSVRGLRGLGLRRPVPAWGGLAGHAPGSGADTPLTAAEVGVELARAAAEGGDGRRMAELLWGPDTGARALVMPLVAADELVGVLAVRMSAQRQIDPEERELAASIAGQTAVGITNVRMIERLTAHNAIKDFLEDLSAGRTPAADLRDRGRTLGVDIDQPHVVLLAVPRSGPASRSWDDVARALEVAAGRAFPGSLFDRRDGAVRGLVHLGSRDAVHAAGRLREIHAGLNKDHPLAIGLSQRCEGAVGLADRLRGGRPCRHRRGGGERDPRRRRLRRPGRIQVPAARAARTAALATHRGEALRKLDEYDRRHRSQLLLTLEEYLKRRGNIAQAAQTLYVHPNTLRQRLRRIHDLTGLDVQREDWLMIEIELKLLRLEHVLGQSPR